MKYTIARKDGQQVIELNHGEMSTLRSALNHYKRFMETFGDDFNLGDGFVEYETKIAADLLQKLNPPSRFLDELTEDDLPF
ncbi:MAG: hypothetical protein M0Z65_03520, partial [Firmicutes bacterium]|nr:hypothetical protein [Bacillota bacterium]